MKRIRVVAGLIPDPADATRFLVQQRLPNASRANLWEFPGGKIEAGETEAAALVREANEELAVEVTIGRKLWATVYEYSDLIVELELFAATIVSGIPKPLGAQALKFATPVEMRALPFCEADVPLLDALIDGTVATQ